MLNTLVKQGPFTVPTGLSDRALLRVISANIPHIPTMHRDPAAVVVALAMVWGSMCTEDRRDLYANYRTGLDIYLCPDEYAVKINGLKSPIVAAECGMWVRSLPADVRKRLTHMVSKAISKYRADTPPPT